MIVHLIEKVVVGAEPLIGAIPDIYRKLYRKVYYFLTYYFLIYGESMNSEQREEVEELKAEVEKLKKRVYELEAICFEGPEI